MNMSKVIRITKELLSNKRITNIKKFFLDYFNEFNISISEDRDCYSLFLQRKDYSYCEDLSKGLADLNISKNELDTFFVVSNKVGFFLSENWLPYVWSIISNNYSGRTAIFHVDDHKDMMSPYIAKTPNGFIDMISRERISLRNSDSIKYSIDNGSITIGSVLTAIICLMGQDLDIFHLKRNVGNYSGTYSKRIAIEDVFGVQDHRIYLDISSERYDYFAKYICSSSESYLAKQIVDYDNVIIHFDMDYFNNRYNGTTAWEKEWPNEGYNLSEQCLRMKEICECLYNHLDKVCNKYILIGVSPSFYPCEFWGKGIWTLLNNLKEIDKDVIEIQKRLFPTAYYEKNI